MTRYLAQNLFASFCFSLTILPALDAEKIDNRDKQLEPDGMALGLAEGGARLLSAESVSRTQEPVALRECGCEPGKALSVKRNEMKAPALSVQMSSVKWSICRSRGCRRQTISVFRA
jgi:hypothetical protein